MRTRAHTFKVVLPCCYLFGSPNGQGSQVDLHLPLSDRDADTEVFDNLPLLGRFEEVQSPGETLGVCWGLVAGEELDAKEFGFQLEPMDLLSCLCEALLEGFVSPQQPAGLRCISGRPRQRWAFGVRLPSKTESVAATASVPRITTSDTVVSTMIGLDLGSPTTPK